MVYSSVRCSFVVRVSKRPVPIRTSGTGGTGSFAGAPGPGAGTMPNGDQACAVRSADGAVP